MKLCIPTLGQKLTLSEDWNFNLYQENRNNSFFDAIGFTRIVNNQKAQIGPHGNCGYYRFLNYNCEYFKMNIVGNKTFDIHYLIDRNSVVIPTAATKLSATLESTVHTNNDLLVPGSTKFDITEEIPFLNLTLPKDTELTFDRIYIRKGKDDFDSITFYIDKCCFPELMPNRKLRKGFGNGRVRFWVKLEDANTIIF